MTEPSQARGRAWPWIAAVVAITAALQAPFLADPFGVAEMNAGSYAGVFAKIWRQHGFWNLRGVPVAATEFTPLVHGIVYLHHPPGFFWLCGWGTAEWQVRLASVVALVLACVALWRLLAPALGPARATFGAVLMGVVPCTAVSPRSSVEMSVLAVALWAWVFARRAGAGPRAGAATAALSLLAAAGMWLDWPFAFWIAAVVILAPVGAWWRTTLSAGLASIVSLGGVLAWMSWARGAPGLPPRAQGSLADLLSSPSLAARPDTRTFLSQTLDRLVEGYGLPTLILALVLLPFLFRRAPRLGLAMALAPLPFAIVFAQHTSTHVFFQAYLAPLIAAAIAAAPLPARALRAAGAAVAVALVVWHGARSFVELRKAGDPIMRDLGNVIDQASADIRPDGGFDRFYRVLCSLPYAFAYYTRSPFMVPGVVQRAPVERAVANPGELGLKHLLLKVRVEPPDAPVAQHFTIDPGLVAYLAAFPSTRHAALERRVAFPLTGIVYVIEEVREYRLVK